MLELSAHNNCFQYRSIDRASARSHTLERSVVKHLALHNIFSDRSSIFNHVKWMCSAVAFFHSRPVSQHCPRISILVVECWLIEFKKFRLTKIKRSPIGWCALKSEIRLIPYKKFLLKKKTVFETQRWLSLAIYEQCASFRQLNVIFYFIISLAFSHTLCDFWWTDKRHKSRSLLMNYIWLITQR